MAMGSYDPDGARSERFAARANGAHGPRVVAVPAAEAAVRGAGVVVPATMAVEPSFETAWLEPGSTVCLVSSLDGPLDLHAATDILVVDDWEHESTHPGRYAERLVQAGLVSADGAQAVELSDVVSGRHPGRTDSSQLIVVTPVGLAMDDVSAAKYVYDNASARGLGTPLRLRSGPPVWE